MIENKLIECYKRAIEIHKEEFGEDSEAIDLYKITIELIEEVQQYRAIGTVGEIKEILQIISEGQEDVDEDGISTGLLYTLLEYAGYAKIGTVEECRKARERQIGKKPELYGEFEDGKLLCPNCEKDLMDLAECGFNCCPYCGQKLNWSE